MHAADRGAVPGATTTIRYKTSALVFLTGGSHLRRLGLEKVTGNGAF